LRRGATVGDAAFRWRWTPIARQLLEAAA